MRLFGSSHVIDGQPQFSQVKSVHKPIISFSLQMVVFPFTFHCFLVVGTITNVCVCLYRVQTSHCCWPTFSRVLYSLKNFYERLNQRRTVKLAKNKFVKVRSENNLWQALKNGWSKHTTKAWQGVWTVPILRALKLLDVSTYFCSNGWIRTKFVLQKELQQKKAAGKNALKRRIHWLVLELKVFDSKKFFLKFLQLFPPLPFISLFRRKTNYNYSVSHFSQKHWSIDWNFRRRIRKVVLEKPGNESKEMTFLLVFLFHWGLMRHENIFTIKKHVLQTIIVHSIFERRFLVPASRETWVWNKWDIQEWLFLRVLAYQASNSNNTSKVFWFSVRTQDDVHWGFDEKIGKLEREINES